MGRGNRIINEGHIFVPSYQNLWNDLRWLRDNINFMFACILQIIKSELKGRGKGIPYVQNMP